MSEREVSWLEDPGRTVNTRREGLLQEDLWYPDGGSDSEIWNWTLSRQVLAGQCK